MGNAELAMNNEVDGGEDLLTIEPPEGERWVVIYAFGEWAYDYHTFFQEYIKVIKYIGPIVVCLLAFLLFFIGLVLGLQFNPNLGTALWVTSGLLIIGAIYWLIRILDKPSEE